ncbi:thiamine-phosphate kinase [Desulfonatronovibrio magnus]|uniref:thiamine-phosphate kinase n=1 Tax=Desulfonatronovibrio magnus TaxID=698827 RepID=UPI0005EAFBD1|nr:thiamine-phosphate kinase [Desulfonatronovibrio magnus]
MIRSEQHFIDIIDSIFPGSHSHMLVGRGDDCAVLACPPKLCVSSDLFLQNIHFRLSYFSPADIGYKALAVNLSDLAAHGATPLGFNLNITWPEHLQSDFCVAMLKGMAELASQYELGLTGGDISFGQHLGLCITIWGAGPERNLLRGKCRPGDILFVAGDTGLARCGLALLEGNSPLIKDYPISISRHLRPLPLIMEGQILADISIVRGLMDLSDGLARDLPRFLAPDTGIDIDPDFMVHEEVQKYCYETNNDPHIFSLLGGEDYALLGGCPAEQWPLVRSRLASAWKLGRVVPEIGIFIRGRRVSIKGFDHFER